MIKSIIFIVLLIIAGLLSIATLVAAVLDTEGKVCIKLLISSLLVVIIAQFVAHYC